MKIDKFKQLQQQATEQASALGHDLSEFAFASEGDRSMSEAFCRKCGIYAQVTPEQKSNLRITGPAPYIECLFKMESAPSMKRKEG